MFTCDVSNKTNQQLKTESNSLVQQVQPNLVEVCPFHFPSFLIRLLHFELLLVRIVLNMDDILKFQRIQVISWLNEVFCRNLIFFLFFLQGPLDDVFKSEKICASCIDTNVLVLGTESGMIFIVNFSGQIIKSLKAHNKPVNDISVDNNNGLNIVSCSDSGNVEMLIADDSKQQSINFNEQLKKICIEKGTATSRKEQRSFIVGSASGRLIYHRTAWYTHKDSVLFAGGGSEVCSIAWKGEDIL